MADNVIDTLVLEINSNSEKADAAIDRLAKTILKLQNGIKGLENINLSGFQRSMQGIQSALKGFSDVDKLERCAAQIQRLSRIGPEGMNGAKTGIIGLTEAIKGMNGINIPSLEGIEKLIDSMKRLSKVGQIGIDTGSVNAAVSGITDLNNALKGMSGISVPSLEGIGNLLLNLQKFSSKNIPIAADNLKQISQPLFDFISGLNKAGALTFDFTGVANLVNQISKLGGVKATEASKNLKPLKDQLLDFINGLNGIKSVDFDISGLSQLVSAISRLGGKSASAAPDNIRRLAQALKEMMTTLSKAPAVNRNLIQMTQAMAQLASSGTRISNTSNSLIKGINGIGRSAGTARKNTMGLAAAFGKFYATYWLLIRGLGVFKKSIDISSDLTEVQNVVDVTFGNMKQKVEDLASVSIEEFGMSELTTKQISSRFQAMGLAMGFAQDKMSDMSIELTKLAADMASFYNVEQNEVARSLQAVFTGESEPLILAA